MKVCVVLILLWVSVSLLWAQSESVATDTVCNEGTGETIRLSEGFLKDLERAFEFGPREDTITLPDDILTIEQLHKWVGEPDSTEQLPRSDKFKYDSMYVALKLYLKDLYVPPKPKYEIFIPGITDGGFKKNLPKPSYFSFDLNALAPYIRPDEIKKRKARELAKKARSTMDKFFPTEGMPFYSKQDASAADSMKIEK